MTLYRVGIVGATGYAGGELLRILAQHPNATLHWVGSRSDAGKRVDEIYPNLRGFVDLCFEDIHIDTMAQCDVIFFATPNGTAMNYAPHLLEKNVRVIDLSADFRIQDIALWEKWYGMTHACPELVADAVYGLPEVNRVEIQKARLIACPGCYPTAIQLALLPALSAGIIEVDSIIADAKSGVSGAGKQSKVHLLMSEHSENFYAYSVNGHRHLPEIEQQLSFVARQPVSLTFVPHLLPIARGIEATIYATLTKSMDFDTLYQQYYEKEPFVDFLPEGLPPQTKHVRGSNVCRLSVCRPQQGKKLVILATIDNLVKGAAGQAVQCMNIMYQLPETAGLSTIPVVP